MPLANSTITIVDSSGNATVVPVGAAIPTGGVMVMGSDGALSRFLSTDASGRLVVIGQGVAGTPAGGVVTIQGSASGTPIPISGSITATNPSVSATGAVVPASATLVGGTDGTNLRGVLTDTSGRLVVIGTGTGGSIPAQLAGYAYSSYSPDPSNYPTTNQTNITIDAAGRLESHATSTTDEGSFRDDFTGSAIAVALTGTLGFTNLSLVVTGVGTLFTSEVVAGQWIKKTSDAETLYAQVSQVNSNTTLTLVSPYGGTTAAGVAGVVSNWATVTPTGGSLTVASSVLNIASGTTNGQSGYIERTGDYLPYTFLSYVAISQRIANQTGVLGFRDSWASPIKRAEVQFTGTVNTQVNFVTAFSSSAADIQTTTVTLPNGGVTSGYHTYKIDLSGNQATLQIDGIIVATNALHLPGPYDSLNIFAGITNTGVPASGTTFSLDAIYWYNTNRVQMDSDFQGEAIRTSIMGGVNGPVAVLASVPASTDQALAVSIGPNSNFMWGADERLAVGVDTVMFLDAIEGSTINSGIWSQSQLTMTQAQAGGALILNNGAITTINTYSILYSDKQVYMSPEYGTYVAMRARIVQPGSNCVMEWGLGNVATNAAPTDGIFLRIDATGALRAIVSFGGVETTSAVLPTLLSANYYIFNIRIIEQLVSINAELTDGTDVFSVEIATPITQNSPTTLQHLPLFCRVYNSGSAPATAPQIMLAYVECASQDIATNKPWSEQLAGINRGAIIDPVSFAQTCQLAAGAAPTATTPTNTAVAYTTLGGEFRLNSTASSENLLGVFGYQVPSPYSLTITDIQMPPPMVSTNLGGTINIQEWALMVQATSNNPSTAVGFRIPIGMFSVAASALVGAGYNGQSVAMNLRTPIVVHAGQYLLILVKLVSGSAVGAYRGSIFLNGYFE